jgi:hypothetical protein
MSGRSRDRRIYLIIAPPRLYLSVESTERMAESFASGAINNSAVAV